MDTGEIETYTTEWEGVCNLLPVVGTRLIRWTSGIDRCRRRLALSRTYLLIRRIISAKVFVVS